MPALGIGLGALALCAPASAAPAFPSHPVTPVVIENKAGAGGGMEDGE